MQLSFEDARRRRGPKLAVLPDAARVEERLAALARAQGMVAFRAACSLAELERELVQAARRAGRCPAPAPAEALLLALREAAREQSDGPFFAIRREPGYVRALGELLALEPSELSGSEQAVALGRTLAAARATLERCGLCEPQRALRIAVEALERGLPLPPLLARAAEVEFDAILDWTPPRIRLATALGKRLPVRIRLPWSAGKQELTAPLEPALRAFESIGAAEVELYDPARGPLAPFLRRLFVEGDEPPQPAPVELISCASPAAQAREVAKRCGDLIASGAPAESIAVAARGLGGGVAEELGAALRRFGIAFRERRGRPVLSAPAVRLALSLFEAIEEDFPRERLIELLCSPLLTTRQEGDRLPPHVLATTLRKAHVRNAADLGERIAALARRRPESDVAGETSRRCERLVTALRQLPARATLRGHGTALLELLASWKLRDRTLQETCAGLARAGQLLGERQCSRAEWAQLLGAALAETSLPSRGARGGAAELLKLRELPGRSFEHLLIAGLVEGDLPRKPEAHPLLPEASGRDREALLFHLGLCSAHSSAALFWPRADEKGRELVRSPFADAAVRALGREPHQVPLSPIPAAADCRSASELLARAALDSFAEPAFRVSREGEGRALLAALRESPLAPRLLRVERAALAERERVRAFIREEPAGRFSGQLSGAALQFAEQLFRFGSDAPVSSRQLEDYATCAFRTLAKRLWRVDRDEEDDDELGRREQGKLLHRCLESYFRRMGDERRLPLRGDAGELQTLREVAASEMAAFAAEEHVGHAVLWELQRAEALRTLALVVEAEAGKEPIELERKFGFEGSWPPLVLGEVHVRGVIDRIDREPDGTLLVLDYKSSRPESLRRRLRAQTLLAPEFQLALYAAAVRQREPGARVDAAYLSLQTGERTATLRKAAGRDALDVDSLLAQELPRAVQERAGQMRRGFFEVRPLSCDFCQLAPACRLPALPTDPDENGGEVSRG